MTGVQPEARVIFGPDGSLYGTTYYGGGSGCSGCTDAARFSNCSPQRSPARPHSARGRKPCFIASPDGGGLARNPQLSCCSTDAGNSLRHGSDQRQELTAGCGVVYKLTPPTEAGPERSLQLHWRQPTDLIPRAGVIFDPPATSTAPLTYGVVALTDTARFIKLTPSGSGWTGENYLISFTGEEVTGQILRHP